AAWLMRSSTSGRIKEPPSMVIVPIALITVGIPSSWYGLPDCPKPVNVAGAGVLDALAANDLREFRSDAAPVISVPTNPRRLQLPAIVCSPLPISELLRQ